MSLTLSIRLLGGFSLTYDDRSVAGITSRRSQALLAYLVLHCQTAQPRQRIAFHLWADAVSDEQSRTNLRKELSHLRHNLPDADTWIGVETKTLQWLPNDNVTVDVVEFESALKAAEQAIDRATRRTSLEQAIQLYRGDLLPDWEEDWLLHERERLRQMQGRALEHLTDLLKDQKHYSTALVYAQQWLRLDSLNEAAYGRVMRLYGLMGDRARALQTYHQCMTVLREELGIDPSAATRSLYEQLLQEQNIPALQAVNDAPRASHPESVISFKSLSQSRPALTPLIGRETEWEAICQWAGALFPPTNLPATDPPATILMLVGEPGIGKTRLLEELRTTAQSEAAQILWGTGFQAEMMRPYGLWIDVLRSLPFSTAEAIPAELGFLLPELGQPTQRLPDPSHLFDAVVRSLIAWANQSPLVLILDDIQWLDEASAALLHYAIRVLRSHPVWFACSARRGEVAGNAAISGVLQALRREQRLQTLEVLPLDREQTADLMRHTAATVPELSLALVNQVFIDSGGNPLFALEIGCIPLMQ